MAFVKTSVAFKPPTPIMVGNKQSIGEKVQVGQEKDGRFWDGEKWVSKEEWEKLNG